MDFSVNCHNLSPDCVTSQNCNVDMLHVCKENHGLTLYEEVINLNLHSKSRKNYWVPSFLYSFLFTYVQLSSFRMATVAMQHRVQNLNF